MAENNNRQEYVKIVLTLVMSLLLILFTQWVKLIKNPKSTPITKETIFGLVILGVFSILGIFIHGLVQKLPIKIIKDFPILGWVSMVGDLRKVSWKIAIVGIFVFLGTYLGSAILAQIGFLLSGK